MDQNTLKLSKAATTLGVSPQEIKKWENEFSSFLEITRDENNARVYTTKELDILLKIKNMKELGTNKETIVKLLSLQNIQVPVEGNPEKSNKNNQHLQQIGELTEAVFDSLAKLQLAIEETEQKKLTAIEQRVEKVEKNIISCLTNVSKEIHDKKNFVNLSILEEKIDYLTNVSLSESEVIKKELVDEKMVLVNKIDHLAESSMNERELYRQELTKIGESVEQKIAERDSQFIEMVQNRRKQIGKRNENRWGINFLKNIIAIPSK